MSQSRPKFSFIGEQDQIRRITSVRLVYLRRRGATGRVTYVEDESDSPEDVAVFEVAYVEPRKQKAKRIVTKGEHYQEVCDARWGSALRVGFTANPRLSRTDQIKINEAINKWVEVNANGLF